MNSLTESMAHSLDADDFSNLIRRQISSLEMTQAEYAEHCGVSAAYLSDVINGRRAPGEKLLKAHGMKRVVYYEWIK